MLIRNMRDICLVYLNKHELSTLITQDSSLCCTLRGGQDGNLSVFLLRSYSSVSRIANKVSHLLDEAPKLRLGEEFCDAYKKNPTPSSVERDSIFNQVIVQVLSSRGRNHRSIVQKASPTTHFSPPINELLFHVLSKQYCFE